MFKADTTPPVVPPELVPAFNEMAGRADAAQRLALLAVEMLAQELARAGRNWDLIAEADRMDDSRTGADVVGARGREIAATMLRVLGDAIATGRPLKS